MEAVIRQKEDLPYDSESPLYPFGFGLSYTLFDYSFFTLNENADGIHASVIVKNVGAQTGGEVVQFYLKRHDAPNPVPNFQLCGFKRVELTSGRTEQVTVKIPLSMLEMVGENGVSRREPGRITFYAGGQQPDARSEELTGKKCCTRTYQPVR